MPRLTTRSSALAMFMIAASSATLVSACYVGLEPPVYTDGYQPQFYDGYVVYYDDVGRPYYYANGAVVWVSPGTPYYGGLVTHWHRYGPAYRRWYGHDGYRYRNYHDGRGRRR